MLEELQVATMNMEEEAPWVLPLCFALFGACIGSFLNVAIYRLPRGMSVNEPRRSFCPVCKAPIPWRLNLPIISWLMLRGRSACCHSPISVRYWLVEVATCALFALFAWWYAEESLFTQILLCIWGAAVLGILCIDWEEMVVLPSMAWIAACAGALASVFSPWLADAQAFDPGEGLLWSVVGALGGFLLLKLTALAGRLLFGHQTRTFPSPQPWRLEQKGDDLLLTIGDDSYLWSDLFMEAANRVSLHGATLASRPGMPAGAITFTMDSAELPDGSRLELEQCDSLSGECLSLHTRKEAMGSGDAWIALALGSACGWQGVLFALVAGCFIGLAWAALARVRRGQPMPFGPAFIAGGFLWLFCGSRLVNWYLSTFAY